MQEINRAASDFSSDYKYFGLPLTPAAMRDLIQLTASPGQAFRRSEILRIVTQRHESCGGHASLAVPESQIKKCLQTMAQAGEVEKLPTPGYWRYVGPGSDPLAESEHILSAALESEDVDPYPVLNTTGDGIGVVYAYYFPSYHRKDAPFPVKIGMSRGSYQARIASQLGTSNPERPVIYRIHYTDAPVMLERYLHSALTLRGSWMEDAPGTEWFMVRPTEIDELITTVGLMGDLIPRPAPRSS